MKMKDGGKRKSQASSLWVKGFHLVFLSPSDPVQTLQNTAFRIVFQLRHGIDDIKTMKKPCPFCGETLALQHSLVCVKVNKDIIISWHNTITRIIRTYITSTYITVECEKKLPIYSDNKRYISNITYIKDSLQHHINVNICQRYGKTRMWGN